MMESKGFKENFVIDLNCNYDDFFDHSPDLFCIVGFDGYFKKVNATFCDLIGYSAEELLSRPINDFVHCDDVRKTTEIRFLLKEKRTVHNFENRYISKEGKVVWLLWTSFLFENNELIFANARDITIIKEFEIERDLHLEKITKINHDFKQMTYAIAHDLRSPIHNVISIFDLINLDKIDDADVLNNLDMVKNLIHNLKNILNEKIVFLNERNEINTPVEFLDFNVILEEVIFSIHNLVRNSEINIEVEFSELKGVVFNKSYLRSIFLNLITNAIKYSKPDSLSVVTICSRVKEGRKQLVVSDNGIGFDMAKNRNKIFGLHQKFNNMLDSQGIGLYLVRSQITDMGGSITVESDLDVGTQFLITFKD